MTVLLNRPATPDDDNLYPGSDGKPMADNMTQARYMALLRGGIDAAFKDRADVLVAMDLLWYPVQGRSDLVVAPDVMVVLGRPRGDRRSYKQWTEADTPPQVVFEIQSQSNTQEEFYRKYDFYLEYGVQEFYFYDPEESDFNGFRREDDKFRFITRPRGWVSPLLGIRFEMEDGWLVVYGSDGRRFQDYPELVGQLEATEARLKDSEATIERLAARLRELGVDPDSVPGIE